jgi:hypothetical protein
MVDWESSLRKYLVKKFKETLGLTITEDSIKTFTVNDTNDFGNLLLEELITLYAFALMREDFERAKLIADEVEGQNARIVFDVDEANKSGEIKIFIEPSKATANIEMYMTILPDGVVIDWEKQNF